MNDFAYVDRLAANAPAPAARFAGFPKYNFIGGHNDPVRIPTAALAAAAEAVIRREGHHIAMYNLGLGPQGYPPLRAFVADKLSRHRGISATADDVLITSGSGQGIDMVSALLVQPGDTVLIEEFCYAGAISRFRKLGATTLPVRLDHDGIRVDALAAQLAELKAKGVTPKFLYTIPTIQNPTGSILPLDRRLAIIALARQYGMPIFEDECYADLLWAGGAPAAFYGLAPEQVIHIGSFSKSLAPALRVGYAVAGWSILSRLLASKSDGGTGALDQMVIAEYFAHHFDDHIAALSKVLEDKLDCMVEAVEREFGTSLQIMRPQGGIFLWCKLPDGVDVTTLVKPAADAGLVFNPGPEWACVGAEAKPYFRLCFALPSKETIREGVATLARVCHEQIGIPAFGDNTKRG
jgi:2-aminoadipate transaminase